MRKQYIDLMEKTLTAYTDEHIRIYYERVREEGLREHGFPRLTANIGILIAHGRRTELTPLFCDMMDTCCAQIPRGGAANDFSVKEIVFCLMELERRGTVSGEALARWKARLRTIDPTVCYDKFARAPQDQVNNWACFTLVSEWMRRVYGLCEDGAANEAFVDLQLENQLKYLDENGMYRDPHEPMVYDLVPRGLFAVLLHFGYRGKFYGVLDDCLRRTGLPTLHMQSTTGEIPYGGRSAQFLYNEALLAIVCEYEASRYAREGDPVTAARFKQAIARALDHIALWLDHTPMSHAKNFFPVESKVGCEKYAYFDKYMITTASYLYAAYLLCDDEISAQGAMEPRADTYATSAHFHKLFLRAGDYFLEFDTDADPHYDASGLGRIHRRGAPSTICLSVPCTATPNYTVNVENAVPLSLCAGVLVGGTWNFACENGVKHEIVSYQAQDGTATAEIVNRFAEDRIVRTNYAVSDAGVKITVRGAGEIGYLLPAFDFDGAVYTAMTYDAHRLEIAYHGWVCRYTTDGEIADTGNLAANRNGHYRVFSARGRGTVRVKIEILKE